MRRPIAALVVVPLALVSLASCDGDGGDDGAGGESTVPTGDATTTTSAPTTTTSTSSGDGGVAVAVDADGRVVVLDAQTGEEIRVLMEGVEVDDPAENDVAVTPDGTTVFVTRPAPLDRPTVIEQVAVAGGEPQRIGEGHAPAVSPDGSTLAYVAFEGERPPEPFVVLRDLESGDERMLRREGEQPFFYIADLAWSADGSRLAFTAGEIGTGLYVVDPTATSLDGARRLGPVARGEESSWGPVTAFGTDALAVVERCCGVRADDRWLVLLVNVPEGEAEGGLLPGERTEATHIDSDADAERLLVVERGGPQGGPLLRWDGGTEPPEQLADRVIAAAW